MIDSLISLPVLKSLGEYDLFKKEVVKKPEKKASAPPKQIVTKTPNIPKKKKALKPESSIKPPPKALKNKPRT